MNPKWTKLLDNRILFSIQPSTILSKIVEGLWNSLNSWCGSKFLEGFPQQMLYFKPYLAWNIMLDMLKTVDIYPYYAACSLLICFWMSQWTKCRTFWCESNNFSAVLWLTGFLAEKFVKLFYVNIANLHLMKEV